MQLQSAKIKARKIAITGGHDVRGAKYIKFNSSLYGLQCKKCEHWVFIELLGMGSISGELTKRLCD